ncbi:MAG: TRASH domain-containing protein [Acidobacteria bacterium]|nr:TRASH domain-containing protein [Acidobacteriota bacterium]
MTLALLLAALSAFADAKPPVKQVESKKVCMINEHYMAKDQIAVEVEGKTYYGCCEMCKKTLATDASKRAAVDPVSGKTIDKATAIIAADAEGNVVYFENAKNLEAFNAKK